MGKLLLSISCILLLVIEGPACSCRPISIKDNYDHSDLVLKGRVLKIDTLKQYDEGLPKGAFRELQSATIIAQTFYKGDRTTDTISIVTGMGGGDCGFSFTVGTEYVIYAAKRNFSIIDSTILPELKLIVSTRKLWYTTDCDRTTAKVASEIRHLKKFLRQRRSKR